MVGGFSVYLEFNSKDYDISECWYARAGNPKSNVNPIMIFNSGRENEDPTVFMLEPGQGSITSEQSLFVVFKSSTANLKAIGCWIKNGNKAVGKGSCEMKQTSALPH